MSNYESDWSRDFETGMRDNYEATIVTSRWGTDARYNQGEAMLLKWHIEGVDSEGVAFEADELISAGKGWDTNDGITVYHASGKDKYFQAQSHVAMVIKRAMSFPECADLLKQRGNPFDATVWEGLRFRLKREEVNYGGEIGSKPKVLPQEFLGVAGAAQAPAATPTTTTNGTPDSGLAAAVSAVAKSSSTYTEFVDKAMQVPGVLADASLMASIADEANGIYAQVRATV